MAYRIIPSQRVTPQQFDAMRAEGRAVIGTIYVIRGGLTSYAITEDGDGFNFYDTAEALLDQHA